MGKVFPARSSRRQRHPLLPLPFSIVLEYQQEHSDRKMKSRQQLKISLFADYMTQRINSKHTPPKNSSLYSYIPPKAMYISNKIPIKIAMTFLTIVEKIICMEIQEMIHSQMNAEKGKQRWR